ncbi:MAG: hypothetical protein HN356_07885 [Calditrichaeota bacterium]|nr:hypothetical protein [Calditrichota bacterium]
MEHPTEDKLLGLELELLDAEEKQRIREHIRECKKCEMRFSKVVADTQILGSIDPEIVLPIYDYPDIDKHSFRAILRFAAVLLIGFIIGYGTSLFSRPVCNNVVPQYLKTKPVEQPMFQFTSTEVVDL